MDKEPLWTRDFIFISIASFFMFLNFYSLLVTLPSIAINNYDVSESVAGLYTTVFLFSAIIVRFFVGSLMRFFSRRIIFISSFILFSFASFAYTMSDYYLFILSIRFIQGIGFGLGTAISAGLVANIVPDSRKGEGIGYFVTSSNIAMVLGPFIGLTILNKYSPLSLFWIIAIFSLIAALLSIVVRVVEVEVPIDEKNKEQTIIEKRAIPISFISTYLAIAYSAVLSFVAIFAMEKGLENVANYFFSVFAIILILSRPFTGKWFDQYGPSVVIYPTIIILSLGLFSLGMSKTAFLFLIAAGLIGLGWGTLFSSLQTMAIQSTVPSRAPLATATFLSMLDLGVATGAFVTGLLINYFSLEQIFSYYSFYALFALILYYVVQKRQSNKIDNVLNINKNR